MLESILFYIACFFISFLLCIPIGPVNLEVFHHAIKKEYIHSLMIAFGAGIGDAIWAMCAFFGISPFLKNGSKLHLEGIFLLITAIATFVFGYIALKDARLVNRIEKKEEEIAARIKRKRWSLLKGFSLVVVNPLGLASWLISLSFLKKLKIYIPLTLPHEAVFFGVVALGAFSYFTLLTLITRKIKDFFDHKRTEKIIRILGYILILFSLYFFFFSIKALIAG